MTFGDLVERALREFLTPADDRPVQLVLQSDLVPGATTVSYSDELVSVEEMEYVGPGQMVELGLEQLVIRSIDEDNNVITVVRGANGTATTATHASGSLITVAPTWPRRNIFDAIADSVVNLWPDLYHISSSPLIDFNAEYTEVPSDVEEVLEIRDHRGGQVTGWFSFSRSFPASPTRKALLGRPVPSGYVVYKSRFRRPRVETDLLADYGIDEGWAQLIIVSALSYLVSGRDLQAVNQEFLTRQLSQQGFPVGSGMELRNSLLQYRGFLIAQARSQLIAAHGVQVVTSGGVTFVGSPYGY